VHGLSGR